MEDKALTALNEWGIIRRNLRNASMTGQLGFRGGWERQNRAARSDLENGVQRRPEDGLESVKKTHQVAEVGMGGHPAAAPFSTATRPSTRLRFNQTWSKQTLDLSRLRN
jgi:hypothetical protein